MVTRKRRRGRLNLVILLKYLDNCVIIFSTNSNEALEDFGIFAI